MPIVDGRSAKKGTHMKNVLVTGAGGFIGHHLVKYLVAKGYKVRGADIKMPEYEATAAHEFLQVDLRLHDACQAATAGMDEVYHLAADMGGIGFISGSHAEITLNNTLISAHMAKAGARRQGGQVPVLVLGLRLSATSPDLARRDPAS